MAIREGLWDCTSCGHKGLPGRELSCPKCGFRRPAGVTFYLPKDAAEVTDEKLIKRAKAGADWVCEWCGASSPATEKACAQCGAERGTSPAQKVKEYDAANVPSTGDNTLQRPTPPPAPPKKILPMVIVALVGVLLVCALGGFFLLRTKEATATVTGFSWERSIEVEAFKTVTEEGPSVPANGRRLSSKNIQVEEQVQTGTRTYICGKVDLGNGMFEDKECQEPVYETRYRTETVYIYELDKWVHDRTERATGTDRKPYWPRANLADDERESGKDERYILHAQDDSNQKTYEVKLDEETWKRYEEGETVMLKVNALGFAEIIEQ